MKITWFGAMRLCLLGLALQAVLTVFGLPRWFSALGCVPFLWGMMHLRSLHDGFSAAFWLSAVRLLLTATAAVPVIRIAVLESVWGLLLPLCHWIALACAADGFWAVRLSRGLLRNRSAAAIVCLQILLDISSVHDSIMLLSTTAILFAAALWYYNRAATELQASEDPPRI